MDRARGRHRDVLPSSGEHRIEPGSALPRRVSHGLSRGYRLALVLARDSFDAERTFRLSSTVFPVTRGTRLSSFEVIHVPPIISF